MGKLLQLRRWAVRTSQWDGLLHWERFERTLQLISVMSQKWSVCSKICSGLNANALWMWQLQQNAPIFKPSHYPFLMSCLCPYNFIHSIDNIEPSITSQPQELMQLRQSSLLGRQPEAQLTQYISRRVHFGPQLLEFHQVFLNRQCRLSQLVHCLHTAFEQLLEGRELPIQDVAVEVSAHALEVDISLRQDVPVGEEQQSLALNADGLLVIVLGYSGAGVDLLATADAEAFKEGLRLLHEGVDLSEVLIHIQSATLRLHLPLFAVAVALKADCPCLLHQLLYDGLKAVPLAQSLAGNLGLLCETGSDDCEGIGGILG